MKLQCNIDGRGKLARLICGILTTLVGIGLVVAALVGAEPFGWLLGGGIAAILGGAFQMFEARSGWCAMRAMGFKTPM